LKNVIV